MQKELRTYRKKFSLSQRDSISKNLNGDYIQYLPIEWTVYKFYFLDLKKLLYAYTENTLNGEIGTKDYMGWIKPKKYLTLLSL
jgi:hypothetical protein